VFAGSGDREPNHPTRRVLMIACAFPPTGGPGVQRSAKFAKYLPRFGWLPTVWTADHIEGLPRDRSLLEDLPDAVDVRTCGAGGALRAARHVVRGFVERSDGSGAAGIVSRFASAIDWRMGAKIAAALPDDHVGWAHRSLRPLLRLIRGAGFDAIFSTFSPGSNHLLALELKHRTGLPWVADFRDLWTDDYCYAEQSSARRAAHLRLQQKTLETADAVLGVSERQTEILASHVRPEMRHKFTTITNGFDPADFPEPGPGVTRSERFTLAHVGRFDRWRTSGALFAGLRRFAASLGPMRDQMRLRIVGHAGPATRETTRATGISCTFDGYVAHAEAIAAMRSADALLLTAPAGPNGASVIRAKLFEYLAARRPILLLGPRAGACERIVLGCRAGLSVEFDDGAIATALHRLFDGWKARSPLHGCNPESLAGYSRIHLTGRLASLLDRVVDEQPHSVGAESRCTSGRSAAYVP